MPEHWPEADRAAFAALPDDAKEFLLRRAKETDADYTRKTQELAEQRKQLAPLKDVSDAWGDYFQQLGVDPAFAINTMLGTERILRHGTPAEKQQAFAQLARDYGVEQQAQDAEAAQASVPENNDPALSGIKQQLGTLQQQMQMQALQQRQQQNAEIQGKIDDFATATDAKGQPRHPYFPEVRAAMGALIQSGQAQDLEQAYDMAVWARPELREKMLSAHEAQQLEARSKKAAKARKSARANLKGDGAPAETASARSLEEELARIWEAQMGS